MRHRALNIMLTLALAVVAVGFISFLTYSEISEAGTGRIQDPLPVDPAFVKINTDTGHGSGTHIGNGYILTAAHVVTDRKEISVRSQTGRVRPGTVLWANAAYDIALLVMEKPSDMGVADIDCREPVIGESITAKGNPLHLEYITTWGHVARAVQKQSMWQEAFVADIAIDAGMSGGAVLDMAGSLVGVAVGGAGTFNMMGQFNPHGFAFIVPASTVCFLMGRAPHDA
jgi:serine protease Do